MPIERVGVIGPQISLRLRGNQYETFYAERADQAPVRSASR
jgi:hypothetical protein